MTPFNHEVAEQLRKISRLLVEQNANPFRSRAYINAAYTVENLPNNVDQLIQDKGIKGLIDLPTIGVGIARSIYEYAAMGRITRLNNLRGTSDPVRLFQSITTVGQLRFNSKVTDPRDAEINKKLSHEFKNWERKIFVLALRRSSFLNHNIH
jgi:DNA polymerase/3'-5' exonuclease PolX